MHNIYVAMNGAVKEAIWLKGILKDFGITHIHIVILSDNQSTLHLVKHQMFHEKSKHIDVKLHFVRDIIE